MFRKLFNNTLWSLAAAVLSRFSTLVAHGITVFFLGETGYGVVALVTTTVLVSAAAIGIGFGSAATIVISSADSFHARVRSDVATLDRWVIGASLAAMIGMLASRHAIAEFCHLGSSQAHHALLCGVVLLPFTAVVLYQSGVLAGFSSFREQASAGMVGGLITILATLAGCPYGPAGVLLAFLAGQIATCLLQGWRIRHAYNRSCTGVAVVEDTARPSNGRVVSLALPAVAMQLTTAPADLITLAALSHSTGGVAETGVFCALSQWCHLIRFVPFAMAAAMLPQLANAAAMGKAREAQKLTLSSLVCVLCLSAGLAALITWNTEGLLALFGQGFQGRTTLVLLMAGTGVAVAVQYTAERILLGVSNVWLPLLIALTRSASYCCCALVTTDLDAETLGVYRCVAYSGHAVVASVLAILVVTRQCSAAAPNRVTEHSRPSLAA